MVNLDRCVEICNTLNDLSNKVCVPNEIEDLNLSVFNMITRINKSKILTKNIKDANANVNLMVENEIQIRSGITINVRPNVKTLKNIVCRKRITLGILLNVVAKMINI